MTQEQWQEIRNNAYAVAGSVIAVLLLLGVIDLVVADHIQNVTEEVFNLLAKVIGLVSTILAYIKSKPGSVTVIDIPTSEVHSVLKTDGDRIAGPANKIETGKVLTPGTF